MAKKWIAVLLVICIGLGAGVVYMREQSDRRAPEIICTDEAAAEFKCSGYLCCKRYCE